jgi:hypothetical protein
MNDEISGEQNEKLTTRFDRHLGRRMGEPRGVHMHPGQAWPCSYSQRIARRDPVNEPFVVFTPMAVLQNSASVRSFHSGPPNPTGPHDATSTVAPLRHFAKSLDAPIPRFRATAHRQ